MLPPVDLFAMAGQSNMQGWQGDAEEYPADPQNLDKDIRFYWVTPGYGSSEGNWTVLQAQGGRFPRGHFGPEIAFARSLKANGFHPAIFKFSLGSTGLYRDWRAPGQRGLYDRMAKDLRGAIAQLVKEGHPVKFRAFVWIQGESDAETDAFAAGYFDGLTRLIGDLRDRFAQGEGLPVILGVDEQHPWVQARPIVVEAQKRFARGDPSAVFVPMFGLAKADASHLTPSGLDAHGRRLFDAFMQLKTTLDARSRASRAPQLLS